MKHIFYFIWALFTVPITGYCQKSPIDTAVIGKWPTFKEVTINSNGKFVLYRIGQDGSNKTVTTVQAIDGNWKRQFIGGYGTFSQDDCLKLFYQKSADTLLVLTLGTNNVEYFDHVQSFTSVFGGKTEILACTMSQPLNQLLLYEPKTGKKRSISDVTSFLFSPNKQVLLLTVQQPSMERKIAIKWLDLATGKLHIIYEGNNASQFTFDQTEKNLAFVSGDGGNEKLWLYEPGRQISKVVLSSLKLSSQPDFKFTSINRFSSDGSKLFINFQKAASESSKKTYNVPVTIWSYNDTKLQPQQNSDLINDQYRPEIQSAVFSFKEQQLLPIDKTSDNSNDYSLVQEMLAGDFSEKNWNLFSKLNSYIVSNRNGQRLATFPATEAIAIGIGKRYLVYYSVPESDFFSYEIRSGKKRKLTYGIDAEWEDVRPDLYVYPSSYHNQPSVILPVAWGYDDKWVILYDRYDIWQIDPSGQKSAICLTNGYGKKHHITFRLLPEDIVLDGKRANFSDKDKLLVSAFNRDNKDNGFYKIEVGRQADPSVLSMGPYTYYAPQKSASTASEVGPVPVKATNAEAYVVQRQSANEYPNLFFTKDFKEFKPLTDIQPQKAYNWLSTELLSWETQDGVNTQGVLYKPENFDPTKKYPLIINFYEIRSDNLNVFRMPELVYANINIEWYVSHGYLVFEPDVYYTKQQSSFECALHTMTSAVDKLRQLGYVDINKLGIQGHSWGAMQLNYIITHSNLFKAACSGGSASDMVSRRGRILKDNPGAGGGGSGLEADGAQTRAPGSLWDYPQWYIDNSAIFSANKLQTPLLMMQGRKDAICSIDEALEFFTALRRLGKKAWLLEYENELHTISDKASQLDYTTRMQQFFDHYLKGAPAPKWMVEGIPAKMKNFDSGLELESPGVEPGPGIAKESTNTIKN